MKSGEATLEEIAQVLKIHEQELITDAQMRTLVMTAVNALTLDAVAVVTISSIDIVKYSTTRAGSQSVVLNSDLKEGIWPFTETAKLKIELSPAKTDEYIAHNFPNVPVNIISV